MFVDRAVGIDLGTTNSEIALLDPSERELVLYADRFGRRTVPSAVAWDPKVEAFVVGHAARQRRGKRPPPIESIKRKMGRATKVDVGPHALTPEEISAKILAELAAKMREHLAQRAASGVELRVSRAVVTVPAYFDAPQVEATRRAGELAGLEVLGVLQEPTAAAIYHAWKSRLGDGNYLVYDLGGGTFDVSILRRVSAEYQVLAVDGDNYLGGDDLDRRFAEVLRRELVAQGYALELDVRGDDDDARRFGRLVHLAQEIKEGLSTAEVVHVSKADVVDDKAGETVAFEREVGRDEYERVISELVETTLACCQRAIARATEVASVRLEDIDHVVLVGGSTRVPLVSRRVTEALCQPSKAGKPLQDEVDTCVALGAAIHAAQLGGLRLGDGGDGATVTFTSPLVAAGDRLRVALELERLPRAAALVRVKAGDAVLAEARLSREGDAARVRLDVPLGPEAEQRLALALYDDDDVLVQTLPFAAYRGDVRPRASALSRPSVVAKDIALEVVRAGRRDRKVLLARGTGLPASTKHRLFTSDRSGAVVLRVLQNRLPIKTLLLTVPADLPVGTPVELELSCDEAMRLEARAEVAGQKLWARIEPPREEAFDPGGAVERLLEEAEQAGRGLWGHQAHAYRREAESLTTQIREVLATDPDKLAALGARLRLLIDEYRGGPGEELSPPMHHFESTLDRLRRIVYRSSGRLLGMTTDEWERRASELEARGTQAWQSADATAWRRANNEAQALAETAVQEEFSERKLDDPSYLASRATSLLLAATHWERELVDFVPSSAEEVRALQLAERDRLLTIVTQKVKKPVEALGAGGDASSTRRALDLADAELDRVSTAFERLPSLGLVAERGGA
jgi:molecular chaperone DnaK